ncbi:MAG: FAD-dependent oxidoreductase [Candidatus Berkiella sp.]
MKVAIVGAGLVGKLFAWYLCQQQCEIHIFSHPRAKQNTCAIAAGAMLSPYAELPLLNPYWFEIAQRSLLWWPKILSTLSLPVHYQRSGTRVVVLPEHGTLLEQWIQSIKRQLPNFNPIIQRDKQWSCYIADEAHLNPRQLLIALSQYLAEQRIQWHEQVIEEDFLFDGFDWVIECKGLGAKNTLGELRSVRGEMLLLHAPSINLSQAARFLHPLYGCYIVPQGDHHYMIGATHQESDSMAAIYVKSIMMLLTGAVLFEPRFKDAALLEAKVGLRPTTNDHLPLIQAGSKKILVNGLYRHGFLLAPAIVADIVTKLCKGEKCEAHEDYLQSSPFVGDDSQPIANGA